MTELLNEKDVASNSNDYLRWECYECWFAFSEIKKGAALALKKIIPVVANGLAKKMVWAAGMLFECICSKSKSLCKQSHGRHVQTTNKQTRF